MKRAVLRLAFSIVCSLIPLCLQAQGFWTTDTLRVTPGNSSHQLSHTSLFQSSELVASDSLGLLSPARDYSIDYRLGIIRFSDLVLLAIPPAASERVLVRYRSLPFQVSRDYALRNMFMKKDSSSGTTLIASSPTKAPIGDEFFGDQLRKSGSLVRGFTVGSNRDLSLTSGFRMQFAGTLSSDINILAALTDENSPIQPEGTTQTLQEVDKVFIEIKSGGLAATLGDFNLHIDRSMGGEFGQITRKVQGAQGLAAFSNIGRSGIAVGAMISGAVGRGKYRSMRMQGTDGNQGPYRLAGANGERQIIVIAGSERVFLDGQAMSRGDINDYTIDYASAEVTFTSRRLITSASRIVIDFEYSDRLFERNIFSVGASTSFLNDRVALHTVMTQEADNPDAPLDRTLDEQARGVLGVSGGDRLKASIYGASFVGLDSITSEPKGQYVLHDTTLGSGVYPLYVYAPGTSEALYVVSFSAVDVVPPDSLGYARVGLGQFRAVGLGQGQYLPLQLLPMPSLTRTIDVHGTANITDYLAVDAEFAASTRDQNRLSTLDDVDANGSARKITLAYTPRDLVIGSSKFGDLDLRFSDRFVDHRFVAIDRIDEIEFGRRWNVEDAKMADERIQELSIAYRPRHSVNIAGAYGWFERTGLVRSRRSEAGITYQDSAKTFAQYRIEDIQRDDVASTLRSSWVRQQATAGYTVGVVRPGVVVEAEDRTNHGLTPDSLETGSFRFLEIGPRVESAEVYRMRASAEVRVRNEDSVVAGRMRSSFKAISQAYTWQLREWESLSSTVSLGIRNTEFSKLARSRGNVNTSVLLIRSQTRFSPFQRAVEADMFYEASNQRSARLERVFVRVAKGSGNYLYLGDLNGNTLPDENEFQQTRFDGDYVITLVPGETLYPVVDVKASMRVRFQPARVWGRQSSGFASLLSAISTETYARVDERSSDPRSSNVTLLRLSHFLNDQYTVAGSNLLTQDVHVFEHETDLSLRARFSQRRGLTRLISGSERNYLRERSLRIRSQLVKEIGNETEIIGRTDNVEAVQPGSRTRAMTSKAITSDFSYRPVREWEIGFRFQVKSAEDHYKGDDVLADLNEQSLRAVYAFITKGQLRMEFTREETVLLRPSRDAARVLPYELTDGKVFGKTYQWTMTIDYRVTGNIQVTVDYRGRTEGGRRPIHLARAEAKAFF